MNPDYYKVTAVSYLNSLPFIYGLEHSDFSQNIVLSKEIPSVCSKNLLNGLADISLVPVGVLPQIQNYNIVSNFCIGSVDNVKTVALFSDVELQNIEKIYLDYQSDTSIRLIKVLAKYFWQINPVFENGYENFEQEIIKKNTAAVVIGDRTFSLIKKHKYIYDLAGEWIKFTNLPFVFAVWISLQHPDKKFISQFNNALSYGVNNISDVSQLAAKNYPLTENEIFEYFTKNISYTFDNKKQEGMNLFFKFLNEMQL